MKIPEAVRPGAVSPLGSVVTREGTPLPLVASTLLLAVAICPTVFVADEYRISFAVVVVGHVAVDHAGAALDPDSSIRLAVAVPDRIAPAEAVE